MFVFSVVDGVRMQKKVRWVNMQCVQENRRKKAVNRQMARKPCAPPGDQIWIGNHCLYKKRVSLLYFRKMKWKIKNHTTLHTMTHNSYVQNHILRRIFWVILIHYLCYFKTWIKILLPRLSPLPLLLFTNISKFLVCQMKHV